MTRLQSKEPTHAPWPRFIKIQVNGDGGDSWQEELMLRWFKERLRRRCGCPVSITCKSTSVIDHCTTASLAALARYRRFIMES